MFKRFSTQVNTSTDTSDHELSRIFKWPAAVYNGLTGILIALLINLYFKQKQNTLGVLSVLTDKYLNDFRTKVGVAS